MKLLISIFVVFCSSLTALALPAEQEAPIRKGAMISVESYDSKSQIFELKLPAEPATGPNRASLQDLAKALPGVKVTKDPESLIGNQYKLDNELVMLSDLGVKKQKEKVKPRK